VVAPAVAFRLDEPARERDDSPLARRRRAGPAVGGPGAAHPVRRCLLALGALSAVSGAATVAAPALWDHPVLLLALSPRLPFLLHAGDEASWWVVGPLAIGRLCLGDPLHVLLGRHGGTASCSRLRTWARRRAVASGIGAVAPGGPLHVALSRATALVRRSLPLLIALRPIGRHLMLAGAARTPTVAVAVADVVGTVGYVVAVLLGGAAVG